MDVQSDLMLLSLFEKKSRMAVITSLLPIFEILYKQTYCSAYPFYVDLNSNITILAREFRLYNNGLWYLAGPLSAWELSCIEMVDNVCTRAYTQFYLNKVHFDHMTYLKWIFSNVKTILNQLAVLFSQELSCVEMVDNVYTRAYMQFYLN